MSSPNPSSQPAYTSASNPALVTQAAVVRLPRWALIGLCLSYILAGFVGRQPWKTADISAFGFMRAMVSGESGWMDPQFMGFRPEHDGVLAYWLGGASLSSFGGIMDAALATRLPFMLMLGLVFYATWYAVYHLARQTAAQPLSLAFGGEAKPSDYARAMADAGLLALLACLGLPLLSHEATPSVVQLGLAALMLYAVAAMPYRTLGPAIALMIAAQGLVLSGAPILAVAWCLTGAVLHWLDGSDRAKRWTLILLVVALTSGFVAWVWDAWRWRLDFPQGTFAWKESFKLLFWFGWPALPLALWSLWRWRLQWRRSQPAFHLVWPLAFALIAILSSLALQTAQRSLLLALPALAALAAFALPTLKRSVAALVDWFTLLFFSGCAIVVWVVWISMQTGIPAQPARNVARLAPGFVHEFSPLLFVIALVATAAWGWLVVWRVGRNRAAIWKSLVLPAGGATLSWVLLMTLWLPLLDHARSYAPMVQRIRAEVPKSECVLEYGLNAAKITALQHHGGYRVYRFDSPAPCLNVIVDQDARIPFEALNLLGYWKPVKTVARLSDDSESVMIYRRLHP